ncbi:putative protein kinase RLK-Pelle-DLSV family [Helianthus annuus]|nr:putative protein kinase RLK-Pelle-DLSV family [Helianthus annuus]KAJ0803802.1 putative protein kinase RLK-Pelle-DLSV family [Helianthus annuus]KAJ0865360.1 putative protein kinase RLK-Pelle-DLSV family [Helianthus annuus]
MVMIFRLANMYKGKLQNGQIITVFEPSYGTRHKEYSMNEASILVKLEHENVAKLLGYCIEGTRFFLVYDFPVHAILDHLMFDPECTLLNWDKRYKIILDVARALLYLHRDAPVRVIHCDVKPGNILLDESLSPILSSFWTAKCLAINETNCHVSRIHGTWLVPKNHPFSSHAHLINQLHPIQVIFNLGCAFDLFD